MGIDFMMQDKDTDQVASQVEDRVGNSPQEIAGAICNTWLSGLLSGIAALEPDQDRLIGALQLSSQQVAPGDVFIALPGMTSDGRDYIPDAIERNASAVLYEYEGAEIDGKLLVNKTPVIGIKNLKAKLGCIASRYYNNPSQDLKIIGVTGTNGKTTTAYLVDQAMELLGLSCGYSGTVGTGKIGSLKTSGLTTVDAISMHQQLADFKDQGMVAASMEVSSHGLDQGRVNGVFFDVAVFTNLSQDHLDYHGSMDKYGQAKQKLFEFPSLAAAVINSDDEFGQSLIEYCTKHRPALACITYGLSDEVQSTQAQCGQNEVKLNPHNLQVSDSGMQFDLVLNNQSMAIQSQLLGKVNVPNILATIGVLLGLEVDCKMIEQIIPELLPPPGRMEVFRNGVNQPGVIVDYAHTPDALERALQSIKPLCRGRLTVVFGCGGDRDKDKRPQMGRIAEILCDRVILTDDNPRFESPDSIIENIISGMNAAPSVIRDRKLAVQEAIRTSGSDDLILLAGKGHEATQTVGNEIRDLCDREFVPLLLEQFLLVQLS